MAPKLIILITLWEKNFGKILKFRQAGNYFRRAGNFWQVSLRSGDHLKFGAEINPLVPDAYYIERQDKPFSLQIQQLEVDLK